MIDHRFLSAPARGELPARPAGVFGPLHRGERVLWRGRAGVAEYGFDQPASLPRWTLPETTEVMVTDQRVRYAHTASGPLGNLEVSSGELRWLWPQHLRVQPGSRESARAAAATQIQLVCGGSDGSWPALVFAGGDLKTVGDADRVANVIRQAIARFRVDNAEKLGLTSAQSRILSRTVIAPEFANYQGGPGQTVSLHGALRIGGPGAGGPAPVDQHLSSGSPVAAAPAPISPAPPVVPSHRAPEPAAVELSPAAPSRPPVETPLPDAGSPGLPADVPEAGSQSPLIGEGATRVISLRPGVAADLARARRAAKADAATQEAEPDQASRAADLAARVASLVSRSTTPDDDAVTADPEPPVPSAERFEVSTPNPAERSESARRSAARFTANSARTRATVRRVDQGTSTRGTRNG
jgi:hypothetical protein